MLYFAAVGESSVAQWGLVNIQNGAVGVNLIVDAGIARPPERKLNMPNDLYGVMFRTAAELCGTAVLLASAAYGLLVFGARAWYGIARAFREAWQEAKGES